MEDGEGEALASDDSPLGDFTERNEEYEAAKRELRSHPYDTLRSESDALLAVMESIYLPNAQELIDLLVLINSDFDLAFELVQNVRPPVVGDRFRANIHQRLHNYLSAHYSLVSHTQTILNRRKQTIDPLTDSLVVAWNERKANLLSAPTMSLVKDLRRYMQHYSVVPFYNEVSMSQPNTPDATFSGDVKLSSAVLLEWDDWTAPTGELLRSTPSINLRELIIEHKEATDELNTWFYNELVKESSPLLGEYNELVEKVNAALAGVSIEDSKKLTALRTSQVHYERSGIEQFPPDDS